MTNFDYQVLKLLLQNRKAEATSLIFEKTHILSDAKEQIKNFGKKIKAIGEEQKLILIVVENMLQNTKIIGIKDIRTESNLGLKEAKDLYETIQEKLESENIEETIVEDSRENSKENEAILKDEIIDLLLNNSRLQAVKFAKEKLKIGLKEAVDYVDEIKKTHIGSNTL